MTMKQEIIDDKPIEILDLTIDSDEEEAIKIKQEKPDSPVIDVLNSENSDSDSEEDQMLEKDTPHIQIKQEENEEKEQESPSKSPRNFDTSLDKAVEEIRKGGSLMLTAMHYGIPEYVLYDKLVSRNLPDVTTLLTRAEEENLVKWILSSNQYNILVFKNTLMEKVGKLKRVSRITPIFHKSKYGRLWYFHFLSSHPEIYENEGILMKCETFDNKNGRRRPLERNNEESTNDEVTQNNDVSKNLIAACNIKKAIIVLHDCKEQLQLLQYYKEKENVSAEMNKSENNSTACDDFTQPTTNTRTTGKDISNILVSKYKRKRKMEQDNKPYCKACNKTFYDKYKLKRHQIRIHPDSDQTPVTCGECSKPFSTKYRLNVHMKLTHSSKFYKCTECDMIFKHKTSLSKHFKIKHSMIPQEKTTTFDCDICGQHFNYKGSLKDHIKYKHLNTQKKHSCEDCGKSFIKVSNLKRHSRKHSKERPFVCLNCNKTFTRKYLLRSHLETCGENDEERLTTKECGRENDRKRRTTEFDHESDEEKLNTEHDQERDKETIAMECDRENNEKRLTMECDREHNEEKLTMECDRENNEERLTLECDRENNEERLTVNCDRENTEEMLTKECDRISKEYLEGISLD